MEERVLLLDDLSSDPIEQLATWLADARDTGTPHPRAMTLATVDGEGRPSARIVLLKGLDPRGLVFYSNYRSRKAEELAATELVAVVFHWRSLARQVRVEGRAVPIDAGESDAYFATRPRKSQLGAWASQQSAPIASRQELVDRVAVLDSEYPDEVPRPAHWGGYRIAPTSFEFWQSGRFRLNDRIVYGPDGEGGWSRRRLQP